MASVTVVAMSDLPATSTAFDLDTAVERVADGAYAVTVSDRWNALGGGPNGGYLLGLCLRALSAEAPHPDPIAVSAFFTGRVAPGSAELRARRLRGGPRLATGATELLQDGKPVVQATATFADLAAGGRTLELVEPPELPPPDDCLDLLGERSIPGLTIADRIEYRVPELPGWARGEPSGDPSADFWMRFADGRDADTLSLPMLVDAAAPVVLELGELGSITLQLGVHVRARPAPGWLACRARTRHVIDGYHEEDFELWDERGHLVAQSRQLALLPS